MFSHAINIAQPHSLGIEAAQARILTMLTEQKGKDPQVTWDDIAVSNLTHTATLNIMAHGVPVHATIVVESSQVTLKTNDIQGLISAGIAFLIEPRIKAMLAEALK